MPEPIGPKRFTCKYVPTPEATIAIDTKYAVISSGNCNALPTINAGVTIGTKIASKCVIALSKALKKGGLSSSRYTKSAAVCGLPTCIPMMLSKK